MKTAQPLSFEEYAKEMISYAKTIQKDNYPGDEYYCDQASWKDYFESGSSPHNAVTEDMTYWELD